MRLINYELSAKRQLGVRSLNGIVPLADLMPGRPSDLPSLLALQPKAFGQIKQALDRASHTKVVDEAEVRLLPPIANAGKVLCLGLNYADHAAESKQARPDFPVVFLRTNTSLVAHGQPIVRPLQSASLDFEGELVAVVGRTARRVTREEALDYIAGYSIFNDASVRDYQLRTPQWTVGKNFDGSGAFGPDFVTSDELPPGASGLTIETRLNGQVMQSANTRDMIFGVAETDRASLGLHDAGAWRRAGDGNAGRRRGRAKASGLDEARRCRRGFDRGDWHIVESGRCRTGKSPRRLNERRRSFP